MDPGQWTTPPRFDDGTGTGAGGSTDRLPIPHSTQIVLAVMAALVGWACLLWFAHGPLDAGPDLTDRADVSEQRAGFPMVLPIELPDGYAHGRIAEIDLEDIEDPAMYPDRAVHYRQVFFIPDRDNEKYAELPLIAFCVEDANASRRECLRPRGRHGPAPQDWIERSLGQSLVTINETDLRPGKGRSDISAWKNVRLTTDFDKVTWQFR